VALVAALLDALAAAQHKQKGQVRKPKQKRANSGESVELESSLPP
jgi:hypothetical protein